MSLTKGRIDRVGRIVFHDAKLAVWEEGIGAARDAGGWNGAQLWDLQFKREVFARIVQTLNRIGWSVGPGDHIFTGNNARHARKGDLHAELRISGRHIELMFFQNVNAPDRPDHDGRYQHCQERHMPYLMRIEMERTRRRIRDYLCNVFTGYVFEPEKEPRVGVQGATALDLVEARIKCSGHYRPKLGHADGHDLSYNNRSADGGTVRHGERVWFADGKGRIVTGTAYYNLNNMWWVVTGRYDSTNVASFQLHVTQPDNLRARRNGKLRRQRLEKELNVSITAMKFERASVLRDILFPGETELFNVWSNRHQLFHGMDFCGYTSDQSKAGKFTANEVAGWDNGDNRVIPIQLVARKAA